MSKNEKLFSYLCYRKFLNDYITSNKIKIHEIEKDLNYKSSSLSKVLHHDQDLPLEKAFQISQIFSFSQNQKDYFLNLVNIGNAGTKNLKDLYLRKRLRILDKINNFSNLEEVDQFDIKKKALKNLDYHQHGARSIYTMHTELTENSRFLTEGIYTQLMYNIQSVVENGISHKRDKGYYLNIDLVRIT